MKWEDWKLQNDYEQALRNLNGRAWSIMEDWEKLQDLQAIEDYTARLAEAQGRLRVESDQQVIGIIDHQREIQDQVPRNQILETHDYLALEPMTDVPEMDGRVSLGGLNTDTKGVSEAADMSVPSEGCPEDGVESLSDDGGLSF